MASTNELHEQTAVGPIDFVLLEFPDQEPSGAVAAALLDLVEAGTIRVYDLVAIRKGADGDVRGIEISDLTNEGVGGFSAFVGARSGLVGQDDIDEAAGAMSPGTIAVLIVYENTWAVPFVTAARRAGGELVASARISAQEILDALDVLEAVETS